MTDHYAVVNPEELRPVVAAPEEYRCDECGKVFDNAQGLSGHKSVHTRSEKQPCPECGAMYHPGPGMARHRQTTHGVPKGTRSSHPDRRVACPECGKEIRSKDLQRHRRNVHNVRVRKPAQVQSQPEWNVDDIFSSVVSLMWPTGDIPVKAVMSLVRWREDTQRMLMEVQET